MLSAPHYFFMKCVAGLCRLFYLFFLLLHDGEKLNLQNLRIKGFQPNRGHADYP